MGAKKSVSLVGAAGALLWLLSSGASCGGPQEQAGLGEDCFRADDCQEGLFCFDGKCESDPNKIVNTIDGPAGPPPESGAGGAAGAAGAGGVAGAGATGGTGGVAGSGGSAGGS